MNSKQTSTRVPSVRITAAVLVLLLASGCATSGRLAVKESDSAGVGAVKGAVGGAGGCLAPTILGAYGGPVGLVVGGAVSLVCLPFGLAVGAVVGASQAGPKQQQSQEDEQAQQPQEQQPPLQELRATGG